MNENCDDIMDMLDEKCHWDKETAMLMYGLAQQCLETNRQDRPFMSEVSTTLFGYILIFTLIPP